MIQRERFEEFSKSTHLGRVLYTLMGMDQRRLARLEEVLELAIFQTAYDPRQILEHMEEAQQVARVEREERVSDARLLSRVEGYTEHEEASSEDLSRAFPVDLTQNRRDRSRKETLSKIKTTSNPWRTESEK